MLDTNNLIYSALRYGVDQMRHEVTALAEQLAARGREKTCRDIKYRLTAARLETALLRYDYLCRKAGFRRDQPRWPQGTPGTPMPGGRWSGGAGKEAPMTEPSANPRSRGHHWVPRQVFEKEPLKPETRKAFEESKTGPLHGHAFDRDHRDYNKAVQEAFEKFKSDNGVAHSEDMTPEQAKKFVEEVRTSTDPHP